MLLIGNLQSRPRCPHMVGSLLVAYQLLETSLAGKRGVGWTEYNLEGPILSQINQPPFA